MYGLPKEKKISKDILVKLEEIEKENGISSIPGLFCWVNMMVEILDDFQTDDFRTFTAYACKGIVKNWERALATLKNPEIIVPVQRIHAYIDKHNLLRVIYAGFMEEG
jgi:hypothetical protein